RPANQRWQCECQTLPRASREAPPRHHGRRPGAGAANGPRKDRPMNQTTDTTLTPGQRITLLRIDDIMALTHRYELEVRQALAPQAVGYEGCQRRVAAVREKGKRKAFYLDLKPDDIVLAGWGLPFRTDTEGGDMFSGNACYNLVGDPGTIRGLIEGKAVFP